MANRKQVPVYPVRIAICFEPPSGTWPLPYFFVKPCSIILPRPSSATRLAAIARAPGPAGCSGGNPSPLLVLALGLQLAALNAASIVLIPSVVVRLAGGSNDDLFWMVFAAVGTCGVATLLQAIRVGRVGAGHILLMGSAGPFLGVAVPAVAAGGPALLGTLVVLSSLVSLALSTRLWLLRRLLTPAASGAILLLVPVAVLPHALALVSDGSGPDTAAPVAVALVTALVMAGAAVAPWRALRPWSVLAGVVSGSAAAAWSGLVEMPSLAGTPWIGVPSGGGPGLSLEPLPALLALAPAFLILGLVGSVRTVATSIALSKALPGPPRSVDFRAVQGAVAAEGAGNLLAGLAGTMPCAAYATSVSAVSLSRIGTPRVGLVAGTALVALAFAPKALGLVLAIPAPVAGACIAVMMALLFALGVRIVLSGGPGPGQLLLAGGTVVLGAGCEYGLVAPELLSTFAGGLFANGITSGGIFALAAAALLALAAPRRLRFESALDASAYPKVRALLASLAARGAWSANMAAHLDLAGEEAVSALLDRRASGDGAARISVAAWREGGDALLELIVGPGDESLADRIALLPDETPAESSGEALPLRLLRHFASSVSHQQYHQTEVVTLRVPLSRADQAPSSSIS